MIANLAKLFGIIKFKYYFCTQMTLAKVTFIKNTWNEY